MGRVHRLGESEGLPLSAHVIDFLTFYPGVPPSPEFKITSFMQADTPYACHAARFVIKVGGPAQSLAPKKQELTDTRIHTTKDGNARALK